MKKISLSALTFSAFLFATPPVPEHIENPAWDPNKAPVMDETKPSDTYSKKQWQRVANAKTPRCKKNESLWKVASSSTIEATATKENTAPVKGKFSRFSAYAHPKGSQLLGAGSLDLASWDSGVPARDFRVLKHVFSVEEAGRSLLPFKFTLETWLPEQEAWESPLVLQFKFQDQPLELRIPSQVKKEGKTIRVVSAEGKRFTFLSPKRMTAFHKLMELCNHHFLASFADLSFDFTLEDACPH